MQTSFEDRERFVEQNIHEILDSAQNPLSGRGWWKSAESPWQCLAACFEYFEALRNPNPSKFISFLPIHADGSCNGLQHYAALGRDEEGGKSVNLIPCETPQDVYSYVLGEVVKQLKVESSNENSPARYLVDNLTRKTVKQTVMTFVYGVTISGARRQIRSQLEQLQIIPQSELQAVSDYLTRLTIATMENMFTSAREIMKWLSDCARTVGRISQPIAWNSPLGFPVEQPYRRPGKFAIKTSLQQIVLVSEDSEELPVLVQKQKAAFPPNFIHSLDSTHMLHTAKKCIGQGITFAAVHDSFWTHAGTMDQMNSLLRDSFVSLHESPILEELLHQLQTQYPDLQFRPIPKRGNLHLDAVRSSKYFFH
mgnify:CR=1 FL=1